MTLSPVVVEKFNGLKLLPEQGEAQGSVSMLNADLSRDFTQIGSRGGLSRLGTGTASYHRLFGLDGATMALFRNTGSVIQSETIALSTGTVTSRATWGGASTVVIDAVNALATTIVTARAGASNDTTQAWNRTGTPPISAGFKARYLTETPTDQRYVAAHYTAAADTPSGADGTTSTVFFSDPGALTFGASNWVQLDPNDGDEITGMVAWRELLFVIKRTAMYVFYSTSLDATGNPIFNYRRVDLPARARATTNRGGENIVAGGDGVYLLLSDGVYRTTGDIPSIVSRDISPLFDGTGDSTMLFPSTGDWTIGYATNRIYLSYPVGATYRTLVFDTILREWLLWDVSVGASAVPTNVIEWVDTNGLPTGYVAAGAKVFKFTRTGTSDDGTAIVSSYQSGFDPFGAPSQEKKIRNVEVVGTGTPTLTVLTDYATSDPLSRQGTVTLGTSPAIDTAVHAKSYRGRLFSYKFSASSGAWTATRLTWNVQSIRPPGLRSA